MKKFFYTISFATLFLSMSIPVFASVTFSPPSPQPNTNVTIPTCSIGNHLDIWQQPDLANMAQSLICDGATAIYQNNLPISSTYKIIECDTNISNICGNTSFSYSQMLLDPSFISETSFNWTPAVYAQPTGLSFFSPDPTKYQATDLNTQLASAGSLTVSSIGPIAGLVAGIILAFIVILFIVNLFKGIQAQNKADKASDNAIDKLIGK